MCLSVRPVNITINVIIVHLTILLHFVLKQIWKKVYVYSYT